MRISKMQALEYVNTFRSRLHPLKEFIVVSQFNVPATQNDAQERIKTNVFHFKNNYILICIVSILIFLFYSLVSVASLVLPACAVYAYITNTKNLFEKVTNQQFLIALTVYFIIVSVFTRTFQLFALGASFGCLLSLVHAVFFEKSVDFA